MSAEALVDPADVTATLPWCQTRKTDQGGGAGSMRNTKKHGVCLDLALGRRGTRRKRRPRRQGQEMMNVTERRNTIDIQRHPGKTSRDDE
jgi:hypothetical protein